MASMKCLQSLHSPNPLVLLLLGINLLILNQSCVQCKRPTTVFTSSEPDSINKNLALKARELERTNTQVPNSAVWQQESAPDWPAARTHQLIAHAPDPLAAGASSEAQAISRSKNVTSARSSALVSNQANATSLSSVRQKWRQMEQSLSSSLGQASAELRKTLDQLLAGERDGVPLPVSTQCQAGLKEFLSALSEQELWAGQMLDASATHLPNGLLEGTLTELGHFDECLAVNNQRSSFGQYCSLQIKPALVNRPRLHTICRRLPNLSAGNNNSSSSSSNSASRVVRFLSQNSHQFLYVGLRLGICVPSKCKPSDVQALLSAYLQRFELLGQVKQCEQQERGSREWRPDPSSMSALALYFQQAYNSSSILHRFDPVQQCILLAFCALFLLIALGTWLDASHRRPPSRANKRAVPSDLATSSGAAAAPRRWQEYQVCRSSLGAGSSAARTEHCRQLCHLAPPNLIYLNQVSAGEGRKQQSCSPPNGAAALGPQRNPIAEFAAVAPPSCTPDTPTTPRSSRSSSCMLDNHELERLAPSKQKTCACRTGAAFSLDTDCHHRPLSTGAHRELPIGSPYGTSRADIGGPEPSGERGRWAQFLVCFSFRNNLRAIGKLSANSADSLAGADIKVIHGVRTLSMIWIIFGHTIGLVGPEMMNNLFPLAQLSCSSRLLQALLNATLAVDTFFMLSGLVTAISFVRKCRSAALLMDGKPASELASRSDLLNSRRGSATKRRADLRQSALDGQLQHRPQRPNRSNRASPPSIIDLDEISSVDSASSAVTSFSSASSKRCISSTSNTDKKSGRDKRDRPAPDRTAPSDAWWPSDFKPLMWMLMRYLRLTPAYASTIGLSILLPALGSGPFWAETVGPMGPACRANWWTNLLYLNNFLETDRLCLIHSWYLSNDWQFFLLTLVLFALLYKSKRLALLLLATLILASSAATLISTIENDFPPTIVTTSPAVAERWQFIHQLYYKPWPHLPAYLVGLLTGYLILQQQISERPQLTRAGRLFCWCLFSLIGLAVLNSIYPWNMGIQVDPLLTGLHSSTFRTLWAASCGWLVYALVTRPRNPLALFLGWRGFQITSRLTYCAYLVHPLVIYYHFGSLRERIDSSAYGQLHRFMATLALSYLAALLLSILVESPSIQVQRFLTCLTGSDRTRKTGREANVQPKNNEGNGGLAENYTKQYWTDTESTHDNKTKYASERISPFPPQADQLKSNFHLPVVMVHHHSCGHSMQDDNNNNHNATLQTPLNPNEEKDRTFSQSSSHSSSAIDVEFQKKLAQAIGRGFKIRTKIVNGPNKGQQSPVRYQAARRLAPNKRPVLQQAAGLTSPTTQEPTRPNLADLSPDDLRQHQGPRLPPPQPPFKPVLVARRSNDQLATFNPSQPYIRPSTRKTVESHIPECCVSSTSDQQTSLPILRNDVHLNEMMQLKQKLLNRAQDSLKSGA